MNESLLRNYMEIMTIFKVNKHKVICEQQLYINLCTQMKTILTGLPMYAYWPGRVFVYVEGIEVLACARECVNVLECVRVQMGVRA